MSDAVILSPPLIDFTRPVPELGAYKAAVSAAGLAAIAVDLNLRAFSELMNQNALRDRAATCEARIFALVKKPMLQFWEQQELLALCQGLADGLKAAEDAPVALETLRDAQRFFHRDAYMQAHKTVSAAFNLVSALVFPFKLQAHGVSSPFSPFSAQAVARYRAVDPFRRTSDKLDARAFAVVLSEPSQFLPAFALAADLRARCPGALLVLAGPWVEQWARDASAQALALESFDALVCMDAEQLLPELVLSHKEGKLKALPQVVFKEGIKATGRAKAHAPIDLAKLLAPDVSDLSLAEYPVPEPVLSYRPSRGRHLSPLQLNYWGLQSKSEEPRRLIPASVAAAQLVAMCAAADSRFVQICGDGVDAAWVSELAAALQSQQRRVRFSVELMLDAPVSAEDAAAWRAAGCVSAFIGLMEHKHKLADATHSMEALAHAGIAVQTSLVLGWPHATEDSARELVNVVRNHHQEIDSFFIPETMADSTLRLSVAPFEGSHLLAGDSLPSFPEFARMTAMQRERVLADAERLAHAYALRKAPFAGSAGSAHTMLGFDKFGRRVFAQPGHRQGLAPRPISEGDRIKLAPTAKLLWLPYQLSVLAEIAREEVELREQTLNRRGRDVSAEKTWAYSAREDLKMRGGQRTPHVLAPGMQATEITVALADLLSMATAQFLPVSQLVAKAAREMRDALKRQLASLHSHGAIMSEREARSEQQVPPSPHNHGGHGGHQHHQQGAPSVPGQSRRRRRRGGRGGGGAPRGAPPHA